MAAPSKAFSTIAHSIPARSSRLIHTLKSKGDLATELLSKESALNGRALSHSSSSGTSNESKRDSKVDEWSNGLRETLLSNLSTSYAPKTRFVSSNSVCDPTTKQSEPAFYGDNNAQKDLPDSENKFESHLNEISNKEKPEMLFKTDSGDVECQRKEATHDENNWATTIHKTVDLNMTDLAGTRVNEEKKNLTMDINVIVRIKPYENRNKIGFQEVAANNKISQGNEYVHSKAAQTALRDDCDKTSDNRTRLPEESLKEGSELAKTDPLISHELLIEELRKVYNFYKSQQDMDTLLAETTNKNVSPTLVRNLMRVKELYFNNLKYSDVSVDGKIQENNAHPREQVEADVPHGQNITTHNGGPSSDCTAAPQSPLDISHTLGTYSARSFLQMKPFLPGLMSRPFSTSSQKLKHKKDNKGDCDKAKKLPCLQASELSKKKADTGAGKKGVCEKFCMPCCKPARDPPECFYPYHKPHCERHKPPRPAFSECKQLFAIKEVTPCECLRPRGSTCKKSKESHKCAK